MPTRSAAVFHSHRVFRPTLKAFLVLLFLLISLILLAGCTYPVFVRGVQVEDKSAIPDGSVMRVVLMPDTDPIRGHEAMQRKIEYLLEQKGYQVTQDDDADYYLLFKCDVDAALNRMSLGPPSGTQGGMVTRHEPGPFERSLLMHVVEAEPFRSEELEQVVWAGSAVIHEAPTDGPVFDDMLVVAGFRHFPVDTGVTVTVKLSTGSTAVKRMGDL